MQGLQVGDGMSVRYPGILMCLPECHNSGRITLTQGHDIVSVFYDTQLGGQLTEKVARHVAFKLVSTIDFDNAALIILDQSGKILATGDKRR